jgi:hypothetical protein
MVTKRPTKKTAYPTNSSVGGYLIAYVGDGTVYCGLCAQEADDKSELKSGILYDTHVECDECQADLSN